ncbi:putative ribonuclease H-like domain-containing protein [Tanacetum coccineum]
MHSFLVQDTPSTPLRAYPFHGSRNFLVKHKVLDHGNPQRDLKDKGVIDSGCSRTPQQNGVAKRKNKTLIEAARTMLADSKLLTTFWAEAVNTACYVQNRVLVIKPQNKTLYELFLGRKPALSFMRPFGCPVTFLNIIDHLGKFDGKADEGFFVGYSTNSKAFRVFNSRTKTVEENLHVQFSENTPNIAGSTKACDNAGKARIETIPGKDYILLPLSIQDPPFSYSSMDSPDAGFKPSGDEEKKDAEDPRNKSENPTEGKDYNTLNLIIIKGAYRCILGNKREAGEVPSIEEPRINQEKDDNINSTNNINTASDGNSINNVNVVSSTVNADGSEVNVVDPKISIELPNDLNMPELKDIVYSDDDEDVGAEADINNLDTHIPVSPLLTARIHKDHPVEQIIENIYSTPQTRRMTKSVTEQAMFSSVQQRTNHKDFQNCLFACFLSQEEPKKVIQALKDPSWIKAMQEELLQIEAIRLFLVYASFKDFVVHQMDVKSAFMYEKIEEEVYVCQQPGFEDLDFPDRVYKRGKIDKTLFIKRDKGDILFVQVFRDVKTASTPMETHKHLLKDADGEDVDEHLYRSMIGSLMYLTSSRPDIMFTVCACARFQVNPKNSHLHVVKRIFRYLKGQPKLGLWYPKDSPFDLVAYTNSDYAEQA